MNLSRNWFLILWNITTVVGIKNRSHILVHNLCAVYCNGLTYMHWIVLKWRWLRNIFVSRGGLFQSDHAVVRSNSCIFNLGFAHVNLPPCTNFRVHWYFELEFSCLYSVVDPRKRNNPQTRTGNIYTLSIWCVQINVSSLPWGWTCYQTLCIWYYFKHLMISAITVDSIPKITSS